MSGPPRSLIAALDQLAQWSGWKNTRTVHLAGADQGAMLATQHCDLAFGTELRRSPSSCTPALLRQGAGCSAISSGWRIAGGNISATGTDVSATELGGGQRRECCSSGSRDKTTTRQRRPRRGGHDDPHNPRGALENGVAPGANGSPTLMRSSWLCAASSGGSCVPLLPPLSALTLIFGSVDDPSCPLMRRVL